MLRSLVLVPWLGTAEPQPEARSGSQSSVISGTLDRPLRVRLGEGWPLQREHGLVSP